MRRRVRILDKRTREDVAAAERALCVAVLAGLRGADFEDLARFGLQHCVAAFAEGGGLGWVGEGGVGVAGALGS